MAAFNVRIYDVPEGVDISKFYVAGHAVTGYVTLGYSSGALLTLNGSAAEGEELEVSHPAYDVMGVDVYIVQHEQGINLAGDFYPYRVMAQGKPDALRWWVINPKGKKEQPSWSAPAAACGIARLLHAAGV